MPAPSSIVVGSPGVVIDIRNPHISIGRFIDPISVIGQLFLIGIELWRKICSLHRPAEKGIPRSVPVGEAIDLLGI
jgi:hypothetical protein